MEGLADACGRAPSVRAEASDPVAAVDGVLDLLEATADGAAWSVFLLDHGRLWAIGHRGYTMLPDGLPLDRGVMARAFKTGDVQFVPDVRADPDFIPAMRELRS